MTVLLTARFADVDGLSANLPKMLGASFTDFNGLDAHIRLPGTATLLAQFADDVGLEAHILPFAAGPYFFAWADADETSFGAVHHREDEQVFDFKLDHNEGDFASLDVTIVNPRIGLLAPGRRLWAWFSYRHPNNTVYPLFFGRLVALPNDLDANTVKLTFIARPENFEAQKLALAETLKVRPYWDPIWFSPDTVDNPDNVLESRPELWHIDRVSHVVTVSNVIEGEDGNIVLGEGDVFYDSVRVNYGAPPVRSVRVAATVAWQQKATGSLNISSKLGLIESFTGEGLMDKWPKAGDNVGGGWSIGSASFTVLGYQSDMTGFEPGYLIGPIPRKSPLPFEHFEYDSLFQPHGGLLFTRTSLTGQINLAYNASRNKSELLTFELDADLQDIVTDPAGQDVLDITMQSSEVTQPIDPGGALPIRDQRAAAYFSTDRGSQSIEYLIAIARARLLARARCVNVDFAFPLADAVTLALSCRKNIVFTDHRLPGGIATGKITSYSLSLNGDTGEADCFVTMGSTVGHGNTVTAVPGLPDWSDDDYNDDEYQQRSGDEFLLPSFGDILYKPILGAPPNDDGINFFNLDVNKVVKSVTIINGADAQKGSGFPLHDAPTPQQPLGTWSQFYITNMDNFAPGSNFRPDYSPSNAIAALNAMPTKVDIRLKSLEGGPFETDYALEVSGLMVPKLIDLEAPSTP